MTSACRIGRGTSLRERWRASAGITLVELLVSMVIAGVTATIIVSILATAGALVTRSMATTSTLSQLEDASGQLLRDVNDGRKILVAVPDALTVQVTRDSVCTQRAWTSDGDDLVVTTSTYSTDRCTGGAETSTMAVVQGTLTGATFHFSSSMSQTYEMPSPVSLGDVTRVTWDLTALPTYENARELAVSSGAAFTGSGASSDGTGAVQDAAQPELEVAYDVDLPNSRIGVDPPVLQWVDKSAELTSSFTVFRTSYEEGAGPGVRATWDAVMRLGGHATTWTDISLPDGHTAQYSVVATLVDGRDGPSSNQVSSGMRPAAPQVAATGQRDSIRVSWTRTVGADSWDVLRDGVLVANWSDIEDEAQVTAEEVTWVDQTGPGEAHTYQVSAVSRWERAATVTSAQGARAPGAQRNVVPVGTRADAGLGAPGMTAVRLVSDAAGAWSSPVAPTGLAIANRLPADQTNPASTWDPAVDVRWTASAWVGGYSDAARAATRYAVTRAGTSIRTGLTAVSTTDTGAPRGATSTYVVTASTFAPHALTGATATGSALTWPAAPSCSVAASGGGQPATRAATVTVTGPAGHTVTARRQRITSGEIRAAASSAWTELAHNTTYGWRGQASNAAGYGTWSAECTVRTATLAGPSISVAEITTRSASAVATAVTPGSWVESASIDGAAAARDDLDHDSEHRVDASATDGYNHVGSSSTFHTLTLIVGAPACSISGGGTAPNGTATLSASGGTGATSYEYSTSRVRTGLGAGTYSGSCRAVRTDGHNTVRSGWVGGGSVTVVPSPYPSAWGDRAGCPGVAIYITPASPTVFEVRRVDAVNCAARLVVTEAGHAADPLGPPVGSVIGMYETTVTGDLWRRVSGTGPGSAPVG